MNCRGVPLVELLVVLVLLSVLVVASRPLWRGAIARQRVISYLGYALRALNRARLQAMAEGREITIALPTGKSNQRVANYQLRAPSSTEDWVKWRTSELKNRPKEMLVFVASGKLAGGNGRITYCTPYGNFRRELVISSTGRVRVSHNSEITCETALDAE